MIIFSQGLVYIRSLRQLENYQNITADQENYHQQDTQHLGKISTEHKNMKKSHCPKPSNASQN